MRAITRRWLTSCCATGKRMRPKPRRRTPWPWRVLLLGAIERKLSSARFRNIASKAWMLRRLPARHSGAWEEATSERHLAELTEKSWRAEARLYTTVPEIHAVSLRNIQAEPLGAQTPAGLFGRRSDAGDLRRGGVAEIHGGVLLGRGVVRLFVGGDFGVAFERQADLVEALEQHLLAEIVDLEF